MRAGGSSLCAILQVLADIFEIAFLGSGGYSVLGPAEVWSCPGLLADRPS